ncbi:MFS transporter [Pseudomonas sp. LS1212]|uniref:MFS transporter n=1 Tax=Pseudomonas sp. LS1212 TaxID=2972478 RepID=UPI00215C280D|nr:MFS transporter [Pseudomonas sp. LS1212]UVJ42370.1 MFS transporter [Pseudomonas sp. LS1212]
MSTGFFAAAIFFSKVGVGLFFFINTWLVVYLTGDNSTAAISLMFAVIPCVLFSTLIGDMADRLSPLKLVLFSEISRIFILVVYAALCLFGKSTASLAYVTSFLMSICGEVQLVSWRVVICRYSQSSNNLRLNALVIVSGQAGVVVGAGLSGIVFLLLGAACTIFLSAGIFLLSLMFVFVLLRVLSFGGAEFDVDKVGLHEGGLWSLKSLFLGFDYAFRHPVLFLYYFLIALNVSVLYSVNALLAPFVKDVLQLDAGAYGKIDAAYSVGAILGGVLVFRVVRYFGSLTVLFAGLAILSFSLFVFSISDGGVMAFCSYLGVGVGCQTSVIGLSCAQKVTDPNMQGRVYAAFNMLMGCFGMLVFWVASRVGSEEGVRFFFEVQAFLYIVFILLIFFFERLRNSFAL